MVYTYPPTNTTDFFNIVVWANNSADGYIGIGLLLTIAVIAFISMKQYSVAKAMMASTFISSFFGLLLWTMELIGDKTMIGMVIITALAFGYMVYENAE